MPALSRAPTRLLRMVGNAPHATESDHEPCSTQASRQRFALPPGIDWDEDIHADPKGSSDEDDEQQPARYSPPQGSKRPQMPKSARRTATSQKRPRTLDIPSSSPTKATNHPSISSTPSPLKRMLEGSEQQASNVGRKKKSPIKYGNKANGRTAAPKSKGRPRRRIVMPRSPRSPAKAHRKLDFALPPLSPEKPRKIDLNFSSLPQDSTDVESTDDVDDDLIQCLSSDYSTVPASDDLEVVDLSNVSDKPTMVECQICGEQVDRRLLEQFQLDQCRGRRMNMRLQELFCQLHLTRQAQKTWNAREYPKVDWTRLESRLDRHRPRLEAIIDRRVPSRHREVLERRVQRGVTHTAYRILAAADDEEDTAVVGYYGHRGAKIMINYILRNLSAQLRRTATNDKLVSVMGVGGGMTGFVQSVLVPELALILVMEDYGIDADAAAKIIKESTAIGKLIHQELDDDMRGCESSPFDIG